MMLLKTFEKRAILLKFSLSCQIYTITDILMLATSQFETV